MINKYRSSREFDAKEFFIAITYTLLIASIPLLIMFGVFGQVPAPVLVPSSSLIIPTNGFKFSRIITVDHTKVPNTDQTNFPILISGTVAELKTVANGGHVQNANGYDVIFTDSTGVTYDYEIESWSATTGAVAYWLRIPTLSHTIDTVIYMWYGNAAITNSQERKSSVWDSNYYLVMHFPGDQAGGTLGLTDSTGKNSPLQGSFGGPFITSSVGQIFSAAGGFDQLAYASLKNKTVGGLFNGSNSVVTFESWLYCNNPADYKQSVWFADESTQFNSQPNVRCLAGTDGSTSNLIQCLYETGTWATNYKGVHYTPSSVPTTTWFHLAVILDLATISNSKVYYNGDLVSSSTFTVGSSITAYSALGSDVTVGHFGDGDGSIPGYSGFKNGRIDETRVSLGVRSADWIKTQYNNTSSPGTFITIGAEVSH